MGSFARAAALTALLTACALAPACTPAPASPCPDAAAPRDAAAMPDLLPAPPDAGPDGGSAPCSSDGNPGVCMDSTACAALPSWSPVAGLCPGPSTIQCCVLTPNVADNPPVPSGWMLMQQSQVTAEMTAWAVEILNRPALYPIFSATLRTFGAQTVMARVEWHPPDFQNNAVHRGVTLYVP